MRKTPSFILILVFVLNTICPLPLGQAQEFYLPTPGVRVDLSPEFSPPVLKGLKVNPKNPFEFEFILAKGDSQLNDSQIRDESGKLVKYFLASLTIPENDLWVNLSPYEKDRIIPLSFGLTEMGRDLLAEDYMLKQITASLIYPEGQTGKKFWKRVYEEAVKKFGTTNIPVNTFNKVWIIPAKAVVYENAKAGTAYVVESTLKVMLEQDYLALGKNSGGQAQPSQSNVNALGSQIVREIVIPELTKEVNQDKNFARLRQVYNSLILATWYKKKIKDSILAQVYEDKKKVAGVEYSKSVLQGSFPSTQNDTELIYQRYLRAFKKGVFNYIKEETIVAAGIPGKEQEIFPRKYFSGGTDLKLDSAMQVRNDAALITADVNTKGTFIVDVNINSANNAMLGDMFKRIFGKSNPEDDPREGEILHDFSDRRAAINVNVNIPEELNSYLVGRDSLDQQSDKYFGRYKLISREREVYKLGPMFFLVLWGMNKSSPDALIREYERDFQISHNVSNVMFISPKSAVSGIPFNSHMAAVSAVMLNNQAKIKDNVFLDLGSGSGPLAIEALKLGAKKVILVEKDPNEIAAARALLEAQGSQDGINYKEGIDFFIIPQDLNEKEQILQELKAHLTEEEIEKMVAVANLGPWPQYGEANQFANEIIVKLKPHLFINGGYSSEDSKENGLHRTAFHTEAEYLRQNSFVVQKFQLGESDIDPAGGVRVLLAQNKAQLADQIVAQWLKGNGGNAIISADDGEQFEFRYSGSENEQDTAENVRTEHRINVYHQGENIGLINFYIDENKKAGARSSIKMWMSFNKDNQIGGEHVTQAIFVDKDYSRKYKGIGISLMGFMMQIAQQKGAYLVKVLETINSGFFRNLGFQDLGSQNMFFLFDETWMNKNKAGLPQVEIKKRPENEAMKTPTENKLDQRNMKLSQVNNGGIDLTTAKMNLQTTNAGGEIEFHLDAVQLAQLQNVPGFTPVVVSITPLGDLQKFLGIVNQT